MSLDYLQYKLEFISKLIDEFKQYAQLDKNEEYEMNHEWFRADLDRPSNDANCLVTWWDEETEKYVDPIRAYWSIERKGFFLLDSHIAFPLKVDIWTYYPQLPKGKI